MRRENDISDVARCDPDICRRRCTRSGRVEVLCQFWAIIARRTDSVFQDASMFRRLTANVRIPHLFGRSHQLSRFTKADIGGGKMQAERMAGLVSRKRLNVRLIS